MNKTSWFLSVLVACLFGVIGQAGEAKAQFTDCSSVSEIPQSECQALVDLYDSTNGANWTTKTGWKQTTTPCTWYGVTCSGGHVTQLELSNNQLSGSIPESIGNLSQLSQLYLSNNQLSGNIPASIGNMSNLYYLLLSDNQLSGNIPESIGSLSNLEALDLSNNQLGVDQAVVSPAAISITAMAPWRSRPNCSGLDEAA